MSPVALALAVVGVVLAVLGYGRARGPWRRYRALRAQDENAERYRAWRGGPSSAAEGPTGASVAMAILRREARAWAAVAAIGVGLVLVGLVVAAG